jgi:long-subunit fatty acid transport protein
MKLNKKNNLTLGLTYGLGHKLGTDPECMIISTPSSGTADTLTYKASNGLELPTSYGAGFIWEHANQLRIGADYSLQKWSSVVYPEYTYVNGKPSYQTNTNMFKDRHKFTLGGEYCPNETGRKFFESIHYRAGASYTTSYLKINGNDGPKEYSVSAGFGIPIRNSWNSRSMLNISGQWVRSDSKSFITENTFRINIGITFNERWFAKWKVN